MQTAMNKIQGSEHGLVTIVYDIFNTGETIATTKRGEPTHDRDQAPPFRQSSFSRLSGLILESRLGFELENVFKFCICPKMKLSN